MPDNLETDYLVIGAGAMAMAFVDTLLSETDAEVVMVDRRHAPGGHWNDAYPFVRLHQPSSFYGVASTALGQGRIDETGLNAGFYELASGPEIVAYFDRVMRERFLPSGRVRYFPMSEYRREDGIRPLLGGAERSVRVRRRVVDSTWFDTTIPATHQRAFTVADGAACAPPNQLPNLAAQFDAFVILGGGKTAMDVGVWLLSNGADPARITWVRPRESWLVNRATTQAGEQFFKTSIGGFADQLQAMAEGRSIDDVFDRLEAAGAMLRLDPAGPRPEMMHFATISTGEIALLRQIKTVLRFGRVSHIAPDRIIASGGEARIDGRALYIDCTARAFSLRTPEPIFREGEIMLQGVRAPLVSFSAAFIAHIEATRGSDEEKNHLCRPIPVPDTPMQWARTTLANLLNQSIWSQDRELRAWMTECRLDPFTKITRSADVNDPEQAEIIARLRAYAMPAAQNLQRLIAA